MTMHPAHTKSRSSAARPHTVIAPSRTNSVAATTATIDQPDDLYFRKRELEFRGQELHLERQKMFLGALMPPVLAGLRALAGAVFLNQRQNSASLEVERQKSEAAYVLEVIKTGDQEVAKRNLLFLVKLGFLRDLDGRIKALEKTPEQTPVLPMGAATKPRVEISVNGSRETVTVNGKEPFSYNWSASNATACQMTSPSRSGIATQGTSLAIPPEHPYYPKAGSHTTFVLVCTNGFSVGVDSIVVRR